MVSPGCSEKPPPKADKRGLETENGTGADPPEAERDEDALRKKNISSMSLFVSVINACGSGIMLKFVSVELIINRLQQLYKTPLCR